MANSAGTNDAYQVFCPMKSRRSYGPNLALRNFRRALNLSQGKLAALVGRTQPEIARLENGTRRMTVEWANVLAPHLRRAPQDLLTNLSPTNPNPAGDDQAYPIDDEIMRRAVMVGRRLGGNDDALLSEIAALFYTLLSRERDGFSITDDEYTLTILEKFIIRLKTREPPGGEP
jgi:transcriptional regulator with XRE-family HTH domain